MKNIKVPLKDKIEQKLVWLSPELRGCRSIRKWKCSYLKKAYQISPGEEYAERLLMTAEEGNERILSLISNGGGYCVGKIGDVELFNVLDYSIKKKVGRLNKWRLNNNAGFFTHSDDENEYLRFCNTYIDALRSMDLFGVWFMPGEDYIIDRYSPNAGISKLRCLEPYFYDNPWSSALMGKKILVISPFDTLIKRQYNKREFLFENKMVLPEFELKTFRAVQTIGVMKDERFESWFAALQYMENEISKIDFDVALIGCGAYSLPLASFIKSLGKGAIHTGGTTQILFGIKGKRWDDMPDINRYYNDFWVRPTHSSDIDKATTATEDYW